MKLKDQVAIVTGAGTGMGRAIAERFAAEGAKVLGNYRTSKDAAEEVVAGIKEKGGEAEAYQARRFRRCRGPQDGRRYRTALGKAGRAGQ